MVGLQTANYFGNKNNDGVLSREQEKNANIFNILISDARMFWKEREQDRNTREASIAAESRDAQGIEAHLDELEYLYNVITSDTVHNAMTKKFMDQFVCESEQSDPEVHNEEIL